MPITYLEGSKNLASSAGSAETNIQEGLEGAVVTIEGSDIEVLSVDVGVSGVFGVELELLQGPAGKQQASCIG